MSSVLGWFRQPKSGAKVARKIASTASSMISAGGHVVPTLATVIPSPVSPVAVADRRDILMRPSTIFLAAAMAIAVAGTAAAQPQDRAWVSCLRKPFNANEIVKDCTAVIDSPRVTKADKVIALNNRAIGRGAGPEAIRDLDEAIKLAPDMAKLHHNRGWSRPETGDQQIADFTAAIRLDPKYAVAYTARGEAYLSMEKYDEAIRDLSEAIRLAPTYMHPMYNPYESRARAKEAKKDTKGAAADRATYLRIMGNTGKGAPGPNAIGQRAWEPWLVK
jgi:hypothetical protein